MAARAKAADRSNVHTAGLDGCGINGTLNLADDVDYLIDYATDYANGTNPDFNSNGNCTVSYNVEKL